MIISLILISVVLLSVSTAFAISDDNSTLNEVDEIASDEDVLAVDEDSSILEENDEAVLQEAASDEIVSASEVVTNSTFSNYFSDSGELLDNVTADELVFEGDFSGVSNYITIAAPIKFTGKNATFDGTAFIIGSDNVIIDGFDITVSDAYGIYVEDAENITLSNNVIKFTGLEDVDSYAIYAVAVNNLKIINNNIAYFGLTNSTSINNALRVEGHVETNIDDEIENIAYSNNIIVEGNVFNISMPSLDVGYDSYYNSVAYTEGVVIVTSENVYFTDNSIDIQYNNYSGSYDTIDALVIGNGNWGMDEDSDFCYYNQCKNVTIDNNVVNAKGHYYIYAISVGAEGAFINNNNVTVVSDVHYADAIQIHGPSSGIVIEENDLEIEAPNLAFGLYAYQYMGPIEDVIFHDNNIEATAYAVCGMEIVGSNFTIFDNIVELAGNYTTGIVGDIDGGKIIGNAIYALGSNNGTAATGDNMVHPVSTGICVNEDNLIDDNEIVSTGIGIDLNDYGSGGDIIVSNNDIYVEVKGDVDNFAIRVDDIDSVVIFANNITFIGYSNGYSVVTNALYVSSVEASICNNTFEISIPSADVAWIEFPAGSGNWVSTVISEGLFFDMVENLEFEGNTINLAYNDVLSTSGYDSIYVIDVVDSDNAVINDNEIIATGHSFIYGIHTTANNFTISNNNIYVASDNYCAYGINPDAGANGVVENNTVVAKGVDVVYAIYSMMYGDASKMNIEYIKNDVYAEAYVAYAFEIGGGKENIINNRIVAVGNYTTCIVSNSLNNTITGNTMLSLGSCEGNKTVPYVTEYLSTGIILKRANAVISDNEIRVPNGDYAIDLGNTTSTVENNVITAKKTVGKNAIINQGSSVIINNQPSLKTVISAPILYTQYVDGVVFPVVLLDEDGNPVANATLFATIDGVIYNETTDADGYAAFVPELNAGGYDVSVSYLGNDVYDPKSTTSKIIVDMSASEIIAPASKTVLTTEVKSGSYVTLTLKDLKDNGLGNKTVSITFNGQTKEFVTDELGVIKYKLSASKAGSYDLKMKFAGDNNFADSQATTKVKINKEASKLTAKKKTFKKSKKVKKYSVTLKDSKGKAIKKAKLTLKIGKKTFKATTNAKGKATFKIKKLTKKGKKKATVKYAGSSLYKSSTKKVVITIK